MIRGLETDSLVFGDDDGFFRRLEEFNRLCIKWIRRIPRMILSIPCNCWYFLRYLASFITDLFLRRLLTKRGFAKKSRSELLEQQQLIAEFNRRNGQEAAQLSGYGAKDKEQPSQNALNNVLEPRKAKPAARKMPQVPIDIHCSNSDSSLNESLANLSRTRKRTHSFTTINISDDSYDSDEPSHGPFEARISIDAIKAFGPPLQVFGADSYRIFHSSDEDCSSDGPDVVEVKTFKTPVEFHPHSDSCRTLNSCLAELDPLLHANKESLLMVGSGKPVAEGKTFETSVEVHHSDSNRPQNSHDDGASSTEFLSGVNDDRAEILGSHLHSNLPYIDNDDSSEPICGDLQKDVKDEGAVQNEENCYIYTKIIEKF